MIITLRKMNYTFISDNYYDNETYNILLQTLTDDDREYIANYKENDEDEKVTIKKFMFIRWSTIINSLPHNYYNQYYSQTTSETRNEWFKKYLDYPTKNILEMPDIL
jgi:hypothetical protein